MASGSKKPNFERARDKLAERIKKHGGVDSEKAHKIAADTAREAEKKSTR